MTTPLRPIVGALLVWLGVLVGFLLAVLHWPVTGVVVGVAMCIFAVVRVLD
jgi:hypothetical protein